jgi:uncharacterized membrane protein
MGSAAHLPDIRPRHELAVFARMRGSQDRIADAITAFAGTMQFVYLHAAWFTVWILCNLGLIGHLPVHLRDGQPEPSGSP